MLFDLIATIVFGVGMGGIAYGLRKLSKEQLPSWIVPAFAGLGMIGVSIYNEYTWAASTEAQLPAGAVVVDRAETTAFYKPWTYLKPQVEGLLVLSDIVVDGRERDASLIRVMRWQPAQAVQLRIDCEGRQIARALADGGHEAWQTVETGDPFLAAACQM